MIFPCARQKCAWGVLTSLADSGLYRAHHASIREGEEFVLENHWCAAVACEGVALVTEKSTSFLLAPGDSAWIMPESVIRAITALSIVLFTIPKEDSLPHSGAVLRHAKGWGQERWIVNQSVCGKLLDILGAKQCSAHYHEKKDETFTLLCGEVALDIWHSKQNVSDANPRTFHLTPFTAMRIPPGLVHRFRGIAGYSMIVETSTHHEEEDSIRLISGDSQKKG